MASVPPERDATDIEFRRAVRIKIGDVSDAVPRASSLVAVCNKYDLIFVGFAQGFRVLRASGVDARIVSSAKLSQQTIEDFGFLATVALDGPPLHLAVSSDGLTLSVGVKKNGLIFAEFYDIRSFAHQDKVSGRFLEVNLTSNSDDYLTDLVWNPGLEFSTIFAACVSDGSVCLYEVKNTTLGILASLKGTAQATCLCWSPKGKQLVVGKSTGELIQYDQQLKEKKTIPFPGDVYGGGISCSVVDVFWESTQVFFAAYHPKGSESQEQPWLVMTTATKEGVSHVHHEDICFGSDSKSVALQRYYFHALPEWDMIICSSSTALETSVLGRQLDNKSAWERCILADAGRPEIPMVDYVEHFPRGLAVSLNSTHPVELNETQSLPSCPLLLLLSTDGTLLCFHVIYLRAGAAAITVVAEKHSTDGERKSPFNTDGERKSLFTAVEAASKPSQSVAPSSQPAFTGQPIFGGQPGGGFGGQLPIGTQAAFGNQVPTGSQSAFGSRAAFGNQASTGSSQLAFGSQTSAGGQLAFGGQTALGSLSTLGSQTQAVFGGQTSSGDQPSFGGQIANIGQSSSGQFGQVVPSLKGQPHPAGSNSQLPFGAMAQSTAQVRPPPSGPAGGLTAAAAGDGPKPQPTFGGLRVQADLGFQPPKPAEQPLNLATQTTSSTAAGTEQPSPFSKQLPSYSAFGLQKPLETATPKMPTVCGALPDLARGFQTSAFASTPVSTSMFGTSLNLGKPVDQSTPAHPIQALVKPSTANAAPSSFGIPAQAKPTAQAGGAAKVLISGGAGKSLGGSSALTTGASSFGAKVHTMKNDGQESVQPGKVAGKQSADQSDYPFWKYIIDEVNQFNREVYELRSRASGISVDIGNPSEMETLRKRTSLESKLCKAVVEATHEKSEVVSEVKTQSLESWALFEQCRRVKERNCDPNYEKLMRERPLNPDCERKLRTIHTMFQYVDSEQEKIDTKLDDEWETYLKKRKNRRLLETPPMHAIYDALKSNNQTIRKQELNLESICARMQELNVCKSSLRRNANLPFSTLSANMLNGESIKGEGDNDPRSVNSGLRHKGPSAAAIQEKEAKLRQILSCRKAAPIVSTAPNNLSYSKIVSAKDLREILQSGNASPRGPLSAPHSMGSTASTGPSPAGIPGKSPSGRIVKSAVRSSPGQKEARPAEQISPAAAFQHHLISTGRETAAGGGGIGGGGGGGGGGLDLRNRQDPARLFSRLATSVVGSGISQGNPVFGDLKSHPPPVATGPLFSKAFSATAVADALSQTRAPVQGGTEQNKSHEISLLSKFLSSGTSRNLESYSMQRTEGSFAPPSSASRLPSFSAVPNRSQLQRQLFHSPVAESAAAIAAPAEPSPRFSEYEDEEDDENEDDEYGDGYNTDVSQELTEQEYEEAQHPPSMAPSRESKRAVTQQQLTPNLFGSSSERSAGQAPTSASGFAFGAKPDAEKAVSQSAAPFGSASGTSALTGGGFAEAPASSAATAASAIFSSVVGSSQTNRASALGGLLRGQAHDRPTVSATSAGAFAPKMATSQAGNTGDSKNEPSSAQSRLEEKVPLSSAAEVDANDAKRTESGLEKSLPGESEQNSSAANPDRAVSKGQAATTTATSAIGSGLFAQAKATSAGGTSVFGQPQTTTATVLTSVFGQPQTTAAAVRTSLSGQPQTTAASVFGQPQTTTASVFGQPQTTAAAVRTSLFGQPQTTTATVFGQPQTTVTDTLHGQTATTTAGTSVFGQAQTTISAGETGLSGQAQTTTSASEASLFGHVQTTTASGTSLSDQAQTTITAAVVSPFDTAAASSSGGGTTFSDIPSTTAAANGTSEPPTTAASGTGLFGQAQNTTASESGLFGQPQTKASGGVTGLFGQPQTTTTASGTGLFGQPQITTSGSETGLFGQPQTTTSGGGTGLFGQPQTTTSGGGTGLFGQPQTTTSGNGTGLFGQPQTTTIASGTGLFGQPQTTTSGNGTGLFGQPQTTTTASGTGLFGQPQAITSGSGTGLFGQPQTTTAASGTGLFSQPQTTTAASGTGLFSQPQTTTAASGTGLFSQPQTTTAASGTGLFSQPQTTASGSGTGLFGQPQTATSGGGTGLFGQPQNTTSASVAGLFGQSQTTTSASGTGLFGQPQTTTSGVGTGLFGQVKASISGGGAGLFGQPQTTISGGGTGLFGQPQTTTSGGGAGLFGQPQTTISGGGTGLFGQPQTTTSGGGAGLFGQPQTTTSGGGTGLFGQGQATAVAGGFGFGQPQGASGSSGLFGQGTPAATSSFGQSSFGQGFGQGFGQQAASSTAPATGFGQTTSGTGGSLFGQGASSNANAPTSGFGFGSPSAFGTSATSGQQGFGQATSGGGGGSMFGGFGGLGGQPDPEKAKQNVFGSSTTFGTTPQNSGLFTQIASTPFGMVKTDASISGAFSAGGSSIQSSGFGGFQKPQQTTASAFGSGSSFGSPATGFGAAPGFGSPPAFGGAPAFGAAPGFGGAPAFGTSPGFGSPSTFGRSPGFGGGGAFSSSFGSAGGPGQAFGSSDATAGAFANFASTAAPSFDALAMQSDQPTFGSPAAQQQPQGFGGFGGVGGGVGGATGQFGSGFGSAQNLPSTFSTYR